MGFGRNQAGLRPPDGRLLGFAANGRSPEKPKVMTVLTRLGAGGPPLQSVLLLREMSSRGHDWSLVAGSCETDETDMSYLLRPGDRVLRIPAMSRDAAPLRDLLALWQLSRLFRRERPDIVHTHTAKAGVLGRVAARLAGVPVVLHTFHGNVLSGYFPACFNRCLIHVERWMAGLSDAVCALCPQQAAEISGRFRVAPAAKTRVVPLGLPLDSWRNIGPAPSGGAGLTVGWLGRLVPVKDVPLLCEVVRHAIQRVPRVRFLIAGDGPERALVESLQRECGAARCKFIGWHEDVAPVIQQCHLLLLTSRNEGTPIAFIQGMAAGRPFLSTSAGGVVDMVQGTPVPDEGVTWFENAALCRPDPGAFAHALETLSAHPERLAGMCSASRSVASRYDINNLVQTLDRLYAELLQSRAAFVVPGRPRRFETVAGLINFACARTKPNVETACGRWME